MTTTPAPPVAARYLGKSVTRKEDQRLLTGHGVYVDDVKVSGTLHAAFLRSDLGFVFIIANIVTLALIAPILYHKLVSVARPREDGESRP